MRWSEAERELPPTPLQVAFLEAFAVAEVPATRREATDLVLRRWAQREARRC